MRSSNSKREIAEISELLGQMNRLVHAYLAKKTYELSEGEKPLIAAVLHAVDCADLSLDPYNESMIRLADVDPLEHLENQLHYYRIGRYEPIPCKDCGVNTKDSEFYMVCDKIWEQVQGGEDYLCIGCLEKRLGRKLTRSDFLD